MLSQFGSLYKLSLLEERRFRFWTPLFYLISFSSYKGSNIFYHFFGTITIFNLFILCTRLGSKHC
jgi:hypothetical protein